MHQIEPIAHIRSLFPSKFGIPRQSNIVPNLPATIVFEPSYRNIEALRGIEDYDYLWLIWQFSANVRNEWSPTVRPPRLGGNKRMGVFATRSPFRPNALGLSSVRLLSVELHGEDGPLLHVAGADLMDGTPIYDIKPYVAYCDAHADARSGFAFAPEDHQLEVVASDEIMSPLPEALREPLHYVLQHDPKPSYQHDPERRYIMPFGQYEVVFTIEDKKCIVLEIKTIDTLCKK